MPSTTSRASLKNSPQTSKLRIAETSYKALFCRIWRTGRVSQCACARQEYHVERDVMHQQPIVIDFHTHAAPHADDTPSFDAMMVGIMGSRERLDAHYAHYADPAHFVDEIHNNGLDYAVVLAAYTPLCSGTTPNEFVETYCAQHRELLPFCSFNPYAEPDMPSALRALQAKGFKGLKLYPSYNHFFMNEARMYPLYEVAQELDLPILVHIGTSIFQNTRLKYCNPVDIDDVATDFPDLNILMAHGGRMAWYDQAMTITRLHANVHIELSGIPPKKLLSIFPEMERFSHKFVFGTDWPQVKATKSIAAIRALPLSEDAQNRILGGNAARLLHLSEYA